MMDKKTYKEAKDYRNKSGFIALLCWIIFGLLHRPPKTDFTLIGVAGAILTVMFIVMCSIVSYHNTNKKNNE